MDAETHEEHPQLPRRVGDAFRATGAPGSVWTLDPAERGLDANIIVLPPGDEIRAHDGPELDVLIVVLAGSGVLETAAEPVALAPGEIVWLPARSRRRFVAGADGLRYFSVHQRKPGLGIRRRGE
ncbi:cupin domain-containing protein [Microbacterium paludicola]|uniref:cupin domain-containing protein n=1 Tax=Microbacterium paludicola TaxID=300019 RepID=UPI0021B64EF9|nr:cupin domain-containing protein [Microbacterium paludicola]